MYSRLSLSRTPRDSLKYRGWSGGAKVLGKLPVPGRPTNLANSRTRAYCAFSRCGWGLFGHFSLIYHFSFLSPSLWETARYRLKYCLKGPLSPNQPTNQPTSLKYNEIPVVRHIRFPEFRKKSNNQTSQIHM